MLLFNSYCFLFLFLPITIASYFFLCKRNTLYGKVILLLASLFFYASFGKKHLIIILCSICFNYFLGVLITKIQSNIKKLVLLNLGFTANLALLFFFKYWHFFVFNLNTLFKLDLPLISILLPLGISFFTFTQMIYLLDAFRNKIKNNSFVNYGLFVTFFPHLLAGPLLNHQEMIDQFEDKNNKKINYDNFALGLLIFSLGLFKKVIIADYFSPIVNNGFINYLDLSTIEAWLISLGYTAQLYFDFSGYTDMALGLSYFFNIKLPINFNKPYLSTSIQEFWQRWHITLGDFLKNFVYIPLGGNRVSNFKIYRNLFLTFLIGGIWHGASWTFIVWGALHGLALVIHRAWTKFATPLPSYLGWVITFLFIHVSWIFFRASDLFVATYFIKKMFTISLLSQTLYAIDKLQCIHNSLIYSAFLIGCGIWCVWEKNNTELRTDFVPSRALSFIIAIMLSACYLSLNRYSDFLYFRF